MPWIWQKERYDPITAQECSSRIRRDIYLKTAYGVSDKITTFIKLLRCILSLLAATLQHFHFFFFPAWLLFASFHIQVLSHSWYFTICLTHGLVIVYNRPLEVGVVDVRRLRSCQQCYSVRDKSCLMLMNWKCRVTNWKSSKNAFRSLSLVTILES